MDSGSSELGQRGQKGRVGTSVAAPENDAGHVPAREAGGGRNQASSINPVTAKVEGTGATMGHHMQLLEAGGVSGLVQPLRDRLDWISASSDGVKGMAPTTKQGEKIGAGAITDNQQLLLGWGGWGQTQS